MPEPAGGGAVQAALRGSLEEGALEARLSGGARGALLAEIEFEESGSYHAAFDTLKSKYVVLRPHPHLHLPHQQPAPAPAPGRLADNPKHGDSGLPSAKRVLFPLENVALGWARGGRSWAVGSGMQNVGNTCYLNSTLQALFHVPALANWLMSDTTHVDECRHAEGCVICGMRSTLVATQKGGGAPIKPWQVYSKLRLICRHLTPGRQEDAHEFLRYVVEAMEKCFLSRIPGGDELEQYSKETTPLNQILGGYLRSTVRCLACQHLSTTYQHFQDLLLDIRKHSTLDEALDSFFSRERLEDLGYKCEACNKKVSATKQFFIERAPMVLCIALKRFSLVGGKLSKHIQFRKKLLLNKYTHQKYNATPLSYRLVAMVTHLGPSQNCGHYTAIGQAPNGNFYQFDDSSVRPLPLSTVLGTNAYIMFYEKENPSEETIVSNNFPTTSKFVNNGPSTSKVPYGPQLPDNLNRDKSPLKLTFYEHKERKDKPIILNSTIAESSTKAEPFVVKMNGDIEKLNKNGAVHKFENGKIPNGSNGKVNKNGVGSSKLVPYDSESESGDERKEQPSRTVGLVVTTKANCAWTVSNESSRPLLSPSLNGVVDNRIRENKNKTEETGKCPSISTGSKSSLGDDTQSCSSQHNGNSSQHNGNSSQHNGNSSQHNGNSSQHNGNSPQHNGNSLQHNGNAPQHNGSVSQHNRNSSHNNGSSSQYNGNSSQQNAPSDLMARHDTLNKLQHMSHRGYGAPVNSWAGTQASMGRQVFEERREERKRTLEGADEMDAGRNKRVKKFHRYNNNNNNRYNAPFQHPYRNNGYNPFQEKQNKQHWGNRGGGGFKFHGDRRPYGSQGNKHKRFNRYGNGHNYRRH